ncbi:hypothetical protein HK097_002785 [Rhizophlyctis rosea]|uniref:Protein-tyrosine-phosphatase n=1 Tax=Rhizophlyctis rosea TaxID=64517 RepID=A0AAD5X357_9FUNG|nr:hypothetical protein HK097_002785 [Rhizophlyctis rosea]
MSIPFSAAAANAQDYFRLDAHDWKYEMRREMQEILPGLWLGPYQCSKDKELLQQKGISHILCIRDTKEAHMVKAMFPTEFTYHFIEVSDSPLQNLIPYFPDAKQFIDRALGDGKKVFVFCNGGISRSPAFVVAYVMESQRWDFKTAFSFVQNKRFCMNPNEGFKYQLAEYEPIFKARDAITNMNYTPEQILEQGMRRRPLEEDDMDNEDSSMIDDAPSTSH